MKAYSYIRFSSTQQAAGTSLQRQLSSASDYAEAQGWELDTTTYRDLGVSAFRGNHAKTGAFGQFLEAVEEGCIETPCALIVESLDRLGRDELGKAQARFQTLLSAGVTVVTLSDGQVYTPEAANDLGRIMISLVNQHRAYEESQIKSIRSRGAWKQVREKGDISRKGGITPGWLRKVDGGFEVIPERAAIVQRIFQLTLQGMGAMKIARLLNSEGIPSFSGGQWSSGVISPMLTRRVVRGEWQPNETYTVDGKRRLRPVGEPLSIYPAVIDEDTWSRVQQAKRSRGGTVKGRGQTGSSIFTGLLFCSCGSPMRYTKRGNKKAYLSCRRHTEYGQICNDQQGYLSYDETVSSLLFGVSELDWSQIFPEMKSAESEQRAVLDGRIATLTEREADLQSRQAHLLEAIETGAAIAVLTGRLAECERELREVKKEREEAERDLAVMIRDASKTEELLSIFEELPPKLETIEGRLEVNAFLRSKLEKVVVEWEETTLVCYFRAGGSAIGVGLYRSDGFDGA